MKIGWLPLVVLPLLSGFGPTAAADDLKRVVSREHPLFDVAASRLALGRDGQVYLASGRYVLRVRSDGSEKQGSEVTYALNNVAANAAGILATANAHFVHAVKFWTRDFAPLGSAADFLVNDDVSWWAPSDVEAGPSGDFYALDQNRNRVVRLASPGRTIGTYSLDKLGVDLKRLVPGLRVWESGRQLYVLAGGTLRVVAFDGPLLWALTTHLSPGHGGFDVDDGGRVFVLDDAGDSLQIFDSSGRPSETLGLQPGGRAGHVLDVRVHENDVFVKRANATELFEVYDRKSGALKRAVLADIEELDVSLPRDPWTAGAPVPVSIKFASARRSQAPQWRAWLRPLGVPDFQEAPLHDGQLTPPSDAAGLYQLRISSGLQGAIGEYGVDKIVELRAPRSKGTISVFTPFNRLYFGAGEAIPVRIVARATAATDIPHRIPIRLTRGSQIVAQTEIELDSTSATAIVIRAETTRALLPGRYALTAEAPGFTVASQSLEIGPGIEKPATFSIVQHGDYARSQPAGTLFDAPENVAARLERARKLGVNMFVDRVDAAMVDETLAAAGLEARLKEDPAAVAVEKATIEGAGRETIAGYGADGTEERAILLHMDAGLPLGTSQDPRTPPQLAEAIRHITSGLLPYAAFRGWSWAANWWVSKPGADAAEGPEEKAAYVAALKKATSTGAWSPVLDTVSDRTLDLAVSAEQQFRAALQTVASGKLSVMTGPYRALAVLPPITFRNADEVELHYQAEQIQPPIVAANDVDFYKRPGKRAWGHPELWNDDGTGGMILPTLFQMTMRGADGVGWSGEPPWWGPTPSDPRASGAGITSVLRGIDRLLTDYGPWLTTLQNADRVAIVVSSRMVRIDQWGPLGGYYFGRLYEAYGAALYAHRPATFVFSDDLTPDTLKAFKAVMVVGQRVEFEPKLLSALASARAAGVTVVYDGTCRSELVTSLAPLGTSFDRIDQDPSPWQDDSAHLRLPGYFEEDAESLTRVLGSTVPPVAGVDEPAVLLTERASGQGRVVWVVNNVQPDLDPALAWRTGLIMSERLPLTVPVRLNTSTDDAVYDVFGLRQLHPVGGVVDADLRTLPARLFAILPRRIGAIALSAPRSVDPGNEYAWEVTVQDDRGHPVDANVPVKVELVAGDGSVVRTEILSTHGASPATARWIMPIDPARGPLFLRALELFSGKTATVPISAAPTVRTPDLLGVPEHRLGWDTGRSLGAIGRDNSGALPIERSFGSHLKDIALSADGDLAVINAMNWDENLYGVDLGTGAVRWRERLGNHFSYAPQGIEHGFAVEAFDRTTAEGYHLFLLDQRGSPERRFALYGLPKRATNWADGSLLLDRIDNFAVSPDASWVASAGDLGLVVWDRDGQRRWSLDWWRTSRRRMNLVALSRDTIVTLEGAVATAYDTRNGKPRWALRLAERGTLQGAAFDARGETLALRADSDGGRIYIVRNGRLLNAIVSAADDVALSSDGHGLAATTGRELKWYDALGGLAWSFTADDTLRRPRISADGERIVVGSELGTLYVLSTSGSVLLARDCDALPVASWLPGGDLLVATWMGRVERLDRTYRPLWSTHIESTASNIRTQFLAADNTPTTRVDAWGNAAPVSAPLAPNLLTQTGARVSAFFGDKAQSWDNTIGMLTDGKADPPARPWLSWTTINRVDSGWAGHLSLEVDTSPSTVKVTGVTFVEDAAHSESWLRDVEMQVWDGKQKTWLDGPYLLSNAASHTHWLEHPLEGSRFRFVTTGGGSWPVGNVRLGELVFHGSVVSAKR